MPPAAFWAAQGRMSLAGVILAGTAGSYFGSIISYGVSRAVGQPLLQKYGKYFLLPPAKLKLAETWIQQFGTLGVFTARLLPVVRHLVSIPAGALKMPVGNFSLATTLGAGIWCAILSWFGQEVIGGSPELLQSPEAMISVIKSKMHWLLAAVILLGLLYALVLRVKARNLAKTTI